MRFFDRVAWKRIESHEDSRLDGPSSEHDIAAFEFRNRVRLPISYKEFLLKHNGGVLGRVRLFGINRVDFLDLDLSVREMRPELELTRPTVIPFASNWAGDYFCFDLSRGRKTANYPVLVERHEFSEGCSPEKEWADWARVFVRFAMKALKSE
jgi:cell wall assembly regulator SMI1